MTSLSGNKRTRDGIIEESLQDLGVDDDVNMASDNNIRKCPYLDTVNRQLLDFDAELLCSQTLATRNVYVCLVCGKFFEGRGKNTPAYIHSLDQNHYVFMNIESGRAYCLPDLYEIFDNSLNDVRKCLSPTYSTSEIIALDRNSNLARDVHAVEYLPGCIGLNNLNATDDVNAVLHMLSHVTPFRDLFLLQPQLFPLASNNNKLVKEFSLVMRKLWSSNNFKSTVSPQELVQWISTISKRKFSIGKRADCLELFIWLLSLLNKELDGMVYEPFHGYVEVVTFTKLLVDDFEQEQLLQKQQPAHANNKVEIGDGWMRTITLSPFTFLSLEIPPCPLFRDSHGGFVIPQVPLFQLLQRKFDGQTWTDSVFKDKHVRKLYRIKVLPRYLVLHLARFTKNNFSLEKNPTIVTFPVRNLEMKDYLFAPQIAEEEDRMASSSGNGENKSTQDVAEREEKKRQELLASCPSEEIVEAMNDVNALVSVIDSFGSPLLIQEKNYVLQQQQNQHSAAQLLHDIKLIALLAVERVELFRSTKYDLVAAVCHETAAVAGGIDVGDTNTAPIGYTNRKKTPLAKPSAEASTEDVFQKGSYKTFVPVKATGQWLEVQDLNVAETSPQQIGVSEAYILVYEKKKVV